MTLPESEHIHTYFDCDMTEPASPSFAGRHVCVFSARCPDDAGANEDSAACIVLSSGKAVLIVADGVGGVAAGHLASKTAIESMEEALKTALESESPDTMLLRTAILNGLEQANERVRELANGAATTMAAIEIDGDTIRPYHVGDSAILVFGGRGKIKYKSIAHSPTGYGVEAGFLDESEAIDHKDRHLISNFIGTEEMHIAIGPTIKLAPRDTVLLASDGLLDNLRLEEIAAYAHRHKLSHALLAMATKASQRMRAPEPDAPSKPDDLTVICYRRQ